MNMYRTCIRGNRSIIAPVLHRIRHLSSKPVVSLKKILFPLIKKIHPDSCATEASSIQKANLICLQSLNELTDKLSEVEGAILDGSSTVSVMKPLTAAYALSFYTRVNGVGEEQSSMKKHTVVLSVPREFTSVQSLSLNNGRKALYSLYVSLVGVLRAAGVKGAADISIPEVDPIKKKQAVAPDLSGYNVKFNMTEETLQEYDFDAKMFDRMTNMAKYGANTASLFTIPERKSQRVPRHVKAAVDQYIHGGNVLVKNICPSEEIGAIERLREFIIDYSLLLNFHPGAWRKVYFIMNQRRSQYVLKQKLGGDFLIIPANFKHRALLEFIRVKLPMLRQQMTNPVAAAGLDEDEFEEVEF